jgi:hypothetical protein
MGNTVFGRDPDTGNPVEVPARKLALPATLVDSTGAEVPLASLLAAAAQQSWTPAAAIVSDTVLLPIIPPGGLWCTASATLSCQTTTGAITITIPANMRIPILVTQIKATGTNLNGGTLFVFY